MSNKQIDWEKIERDFRAEVLSLREIAAQHGITEGAIRKWAKKNSIERDLSERVRQQVKNQLVRTVRTETGMRTDSKVSAKEAVDNAAAMQVHMVLGHRTLIGRMNGIVNTLMDQLELLAGTETPIQALTSSAVNLSNALKTTITLERQAFNIGDEPPAAADSLSALLDHIKSTGSRLPIKPQGEKA